ncbi:OmpA family protein [Mycoavidus sp. B2-EB]|uniref:OmpA family protein n=1 Tax=Mycoavidus sp. B2-EB TaxID=2651972 RepID=UPI0016299DC9|nr:OmpA family protein [Mycoavidus sp. B2-EB]
MSSKTLALPLASCLLASTLFAGCAAPPGQQNNAALGTGIGAATGAGVGALIGHSEGAMIGGAIGALAGGLTGYNWTAIKQRLAGATQGTGTQITEQQDGSLKVNIPSSVSFATNSYQIRPTFMSALDEVARTLVQNPELAARIIGHTDNTGAVPYNMTLSQSRALAVANYLVSRGTASGRLSSEGRGQTQPIADNLTPTGRAQNRRVEIFLYPLQANPK